MNSGSTKQIPLRQTGAFSELVMDYLQGANGFRTRFPTAPDLDSVLRVAQTQATPDPQLRQQLGRRVAECYSQLQNPRIDPAQLQRVGQTNTRFVVTAHQPVLLGGPLYILYKLGSVVSLARQLNEHPQANGLHFIPLYWVGDEDHDQEEIGQCHVLGNKITWNPGGSGAMGRRVIENPEEFLTPLQEALGNRSEAGRWMACARDCYRRGISLFEATLRWTDTLFGSQGLVVFSGDDPVLKQAAMPIWENEIRQRTSADGARRGGELLQTMGYHAQITPREVNLFWLDAHSRDRLVRTPEGTWQAGALQWNDEEELLHQLRDAPQCISPNVVLRPVYQEWLLQSVAFVGGPAEVAYWLQLHPVFQQLNISFPPVFMRASVLLMDAGMQHRWQQSGLNEADLFAGRDEWVRGFLQQQPGGVVSETEVLASMQTSFTRLAEEAAMVDPSLRAWVLAEFTKVGKSVEAIAHRVRKAQKQQHETGINRLLQLHRRLFPDDQLQERQDNFLSWAASDPSDELLEFCRRQLPFPSDDLILLNLTGLPTAKEA